MPQPSEADAFFKPLNMAGLKKILNVFVRSAPESDTIKLRGIYRTDKTITKVGVENSSTKLANSNDLVIASARHRAALV